MKILVTGAGGQLGQDLMRTFAGTGYAAVGVDVDTLDVTDSAAVAGYIGRVRPDCVIHCAAYTAVDAAEKPENASLVRAVNAVGTENVALAAEAVGALMIYISTDYVFDGMTHSTRPWEPDDERAPINFYGQTKYEGELAVERICTRYYIVRISWAFGKYGKNFVATMLRLGRERKNITVVDDQVGSPTYTRDLSVLLADMATGGRGAYGKYHATNGGYVSWWGFAREIFSQAAKRDPVYADVTVTPVSSAEYGAAAARPFNSRMSRDKLASAGFSLLPDWHDALTRYFNEIEENE